MRSLYDAGRYAEAADRGRELLAARPGYGRLIYNLARCESLAGRADDAIAPLRQAISVSGDFRAMATRDADFDPLRGEPAFIRLVEG